MCLIISIDNFCLTLQQIFLNGVNSKWPILGNNFGDPEAMTMNFLFSSVSITGLKEI